MCVYTCVCVCVYEANTLVHLLSFLPQPGLCSQKQSLRAFPRFCLAPPVCYWHTDTTLKLRECQLTSSNGERRRSLFTLASFPFPTSRR